jgi:hypothetical protein
MSRAWQTGYTGSVHSTIWGIVKYSFYTQKLTNQHTMNVGKPEVAGSTPASSILSARVTQWSECGSYERSF